MVPNHIGIIMDGNGRWAKMRGKPRYYGHKKGADVLEGIFRYAVDKGVKVVSFYAFSTENWARPQDEVSRLMGLLHTMLKRFLPIFIKDKIRLVVSGDLYSDKITERGRRDILSAMEKTKCFDKSIVNICFNYGSKDEIVAAANAAAVKGLPITKETIEQNLWTYGLPPVDLVIRTSGEQRLSNFMLWQAAYAEVYFTDCLWPDFNNQELDKAIEWYENRDRRFGNV